MMRWLIDGYNVIRRDPELRGRERSGLEAGRRALQDLVARAARRSRDQFLLVFDGARPGSQGPAGGAVQVLFSRPPRTADDELVTLSSRWRGGGIVVSSDRAVQAAARRAGCAVVGAEEFVTRLTAAEHRQERAGAAGAEAASGLDHGSSGGDDEDDHPDRGAPKRGNPRRRSRRDRLGRRAIRRLTGG
jgi:predicted RNA-binding protein with PIN domain